MFGAVVVLIHNNQFLKSYQEVKFLVCFRSSYLISTSTMKQKKFLPE